MFIIFVYNSNLHYIIGNNIYYYYSIKFNIMYCLCFWFIGYDHKTNFVFLAVVHSVRALVFMDNGF